MKLAHIDPYQMGSPQIICDPNLPPLTPTEGGIFFQKTQNSNRVFKTLDCPLLLVGDTPGIPLTPSEAKTHIFPPLTHAKV